MLKVAVLLGPGGSLVQKAQRTLARVSQGERNSVSRRPGVALHADGGWGRPTPVTHE